MVMIKSILIFFIIFAILFYITQDKKNIYMLEEYFTKVKKYFYLIYIYLRERNKNDIISFISFSLFCILIPFILYL